MKTIDAASQARLDSDCPRLSTAWIIVLKNGTVLRFTSHDKDVTFSSQTLEVPSAFFGSPSLDVNGTYLAAVGYRTGAFAQGSDGSVDNMETVAILDSSGITERDLQGGLYNGAEVFLFSFYWDDLTIPVDKIHRGWFGEYTIRRTESVIEFRELQAALHQRTGRTTKPSCDADLGDSRCKVNLTPLTDSGSVTSVTDRANFVGTTGQSEGYYAGGKLTWTSGNNNGLSMEVKAQVLIGSPSTDDVQLFLAMPYEIKVGDTYTITPGCDKSRETCIDKFNNILNFQGFPDVPGADAQLNPVDSEGS